MTHRGHVPRRTVVLMMSICLCVTLPAWAATRLVTPTGGTSGDCTSTPCEIRYATTQAQPGDTVSVADGTYSTSSSNVIDINTNSGTNFGSGAITMKAEHLHQAVINGPDGCVFIQPSSYDIEDGLIVERSFWIIDGFDITNTCFSVSITADSVEFRNNLVHDFRRIGVDVESNFNHVHHNVIAYAIKPNQTDLLLNSDNDHLGINLAASTHDNIIQANWIYSILGVNPRNTEPCCPNHGLGIVTNDAISNNTVQGNVFMDNSKTVMIRIFGQTSGNCTGFPSPSCGQAHNNLVLDNIAFGGMNGTVGVGENASDNTISNNIVVRSAGGVGGKGCDPGRNIFTHNSYIADLFTNDGIGGSCGSEVNNVCMRASTFLNNLLYQANTGGNSLFNIQNYSDTIAQSDYNLIWSNNSDLTTWTTGYTYGAHDIHDLANGRPIFVNEATGDYRLASNSPGKHAGSDGKDIGAIFSIDDASSWLRLDWLQTMLASDRTTENIVSDQTSTSFTVNPSYIYQVWAYARVNNPSTATISVTVGGVTQNPNLPMTNVLQFEVHGDQRYFYLTSLYPPSSTLTVNWTDSQAFDKVLIRQMPTASEAYTILTEGAAPPARPFIWIE